MSLQRFRVDEAQLFLNAPQPLPQLAVESFLEVFATEVFGHVAGSELLEKGQVYCGFAGLAQQPRDLLHTVVQRFPATRRKEVLEGFQRGPHPAGGDAGIVDRVLPYLRLQ